MFLTWHQQSSTSQLALLCTFDSTANSSPCNLMAIHTLQRAPGVMGAPQARPWHRNWVRLHLHRCPQVGGRDSSWHLLL